MRKKILDKPSQVRTLSYSAMKQKRLVCIHIEINTSNAMKYRLLLLSNQNHLPEFEKGSMDPRVQMYRRKKYLQKTMKNVLLSYVYVLYCVFFSPRSVLTTSCFYFFICLAVRLHVK